MSSFVGRETELAELTARITQSRLVTILGPGGVGKTRLMLEAADRLVESFAEGVRFVDVEGTADPQFVRESLTWQSSISSAAGGGWSGALIGALAGKHLLVLADNCESAVGSWAEFIARLLASTRSVHVVCTSRERLHVSGEEVFTLGPLALADPDSPLPPDDLARYPAVALFVDRARAVRPDFALTEDNSRQVAELCHHLDGLPLAIELAAARMNSLSIEQLLNRLDDRFYILTNGRRTALPHQRTLLALIEWSYQLCTEDEQLLWARAAVFAGGFELEALETVCGDERLPASCIAGLVGDLVDKSVLVRGQRGRYQLLDSIRGFGATIALDEREVLRRRHSDYFCALVERAADDWSTSAGTEWQARLRADLPNLRLALEYCARTDGRAHKGLSTASTSWLFWRAAGLVGEGRAWLSRFLVLEPQSSAIRTVALCRAAWLGFPGVHRAEHGAVTGYLRELADIPYEELNDSARAFLDLLSSEQELAEGHAAAAEPLLRSALERFEVGGDVVGSRMSLIRLAMSLSHQGRSTEALAIADEYLALCDRPTGSQLVAHGLWVKAVIEFEADHLKEAEELARRSLELTYGRDDPIGNALSVEVCAWVRAGLGDNEAATTLLGGLEVIWSWAGAPLLGYRSLLSHHKICETRAHDGLSPTAYKTALDWGRGLDLNQIARQVLDPHRSSPFHSPAGLAGPGRLTVREREVAELVARGLSNRDIATELFISPRTVEGHVEHVLAKLGVTSRVQIANWASTSGTAG